MHRPLSIYCTSLPSTIQILQAPSKTGSWVYRSGDGCTEDPTASVVCGVGITAVPAPPRSSDREWVGLPPWEIKWQS